MNCPQCDGTQVIVKNTRSTKGNTQTWRRKQCLDCDLIFTTYEAIDLSHLIVLKKSGKTERFSRSKLYSGIYGATIGSKTPHKEKVVDNLTRMAEKEIMALRKKKITSSEISDVVLKVLKKRNITTFLRFLAYNKNFTSEDQVKRELRKLLKN